MGNSDSLFTKFKNFFININSAVIAVIICLFVATYFYIFNFVKEINSDNNQIQKVKDLVIDINNADELLTIYTKSTIAQNNLYWDQQFNDTFTKHYSQMQELKDITQHSGLDNYVQKMVESSQQIHQLEKQIFDDLKNKKVFTAEDTTAFYDQFNQKKLKENEVSTEMKLLLKTKLEEKYVSNQQKLFWGQLFLIFDILFLALTVFFHLKKVNATLQILYEYQTEKEEAQEHMTIMGELTSGINHEIKNIICVAGLHSNQLSNQLKRQKPLTTEQILYSVQKIENSVTRAEKIIRSVNKLSFDSKNEEKKDCSVYEVLAETKEFASFFADKHEVELRFPEIHSGLQFFGHSIQISQVLINLIKNATEAIEHLDEKWISLNVHYDVHTQNLEIKLVDSGNGIPESVREKLFQKQFTTKAPGKGTGLGLTISAKIIADHGGKLYIDDKAKNTTFVINLPGFNVPTVNELEPAVKAS